MTSGSCPTASDPDKKTKPDTWKPTEKPNKQIAPGKMRSDCEQIPDGFSKEDADQAETMEAAVAPAATRAAPGCQVYWPAPYEVCGAIRDKYNELGGPNGFLLHPKSNELTNPDGYGKRTEFVNGPIYWSARGGAHPVVNHFLAAWARHRYEAGYIGYPTTDEIVNPDNIGRRQEFQGAAIYWRLNEAYAIGGAIRDKWNGAGAERGPLGYPTTDELPAKKNNGRYNNFENGTVTWSGPAGTRLMYGAFRDRWAKAGREDGELGYPTADEQITPNKLGRYALFEGGSIYQKNEGPGPFVVKGAIRDQWGSLGWEGGRFGFPTSEEYDLDRGKAQDYERGTLVWNIGDELSDFDPPTGKCPDSVCVSPPPGIRSLETNSPRSAQPEERGVPTCAEVRAMPANPGRELLCVENPSDERQLRNNPTYPSDSAVQKACYDAQPYTYRERLYSCFVSRVTYLINAPGEPKPNGGVALVFEMESRTQWSTKEFTLRHHLIVEDTFGTMQYAKIKATPICHAIGQSCDIKGKKMDWSEMEPGKRFFTEYKVEPGDVPQGQILAVDQLGADFNFAPSPSYTWKEVQHTQKALLDTIRCDNDMSANKPGCIIPAITPVLSYNNPAKNGELAGHIAAAQNSGVAGKPGTGVPLHKGTKELETENRDNSCTKNPGVPSPRPQGRDCDEYPFASAREGAAAGGAERTFDGCLLPTVAIGPTGPGYSICMINPSHNRSGGSDVRWFYHWNRVLKNDPFYVEALNGYLPAP